MLKVEEVTKKFATQEEKVSKSIKVLQGITFHIKPGEVVTLLGPNGCGKTTLLDIIVGLQQPDSGTILLGKAKSTPVKVAYVQQKFAESLFPWRTVRQNLTFPLEIMHVPKQDWETRLKPLYAMFRDLNIPLDEFPYNLSTGQQQMVCIARALTIKPSLLLLDEPFNALHYDVHRLLQTKFYELWKDTGISILIVSHNISDALFLADRVLVMTKKPSYIKTAVDLSKVAKPRWEENMNSLLNQKRQEIVNSLAWEADVL